MIAGIKALKIWPEYYEAVIAGCKKAEFRDIRDWDEPPSVGMVLALMEADPKKQRYTGRATLVKVTDVATGAAIPDGFAMLSFDFMDVTEGLLDDVMSETMKASFELADEGELLSTSERFSLYASVATGVRILRAYACAEEMW